MKKLLISVLALGLLAGNAMAACMGPYCYDDTGAIITANPFVINTLSNLQTTIIPAYTSQIAICTDCTGRLCISTGTTKNSWVAVASTAAVVNAVAACH